MHFLLNNGSTLIVGAGIDGQIYISDGVSATPVAQIPNSIANLDGGLYLEFMPGAVCNYKKKVYFGVSSGGSATTIPGMGVYSLTRTANGNILVHEHTISTGSDGDGEILKIGALLPVTRDNILIGWRDATTYGIDNITVTSRTTSYGGYFITPLYTVGSNKGTRKFQEIEFQLARPLRANEGIKVDYRTNLTASFTNLSTWDFATFGAKVSYNQILIKGTVDIDIPAGEQLQLKIYLTGTTTSPELKSVTLR